MIKKRIKKFLKINLKKYSYSINIFKTFNIFHPHQTQFLKNQFFEQ